MLNRTQKNYLTVFSQLRINLGQHLCILYVCMKYNINYYLGKRGMAHIITENTNMIRTTSPCYKIEAKNSRHTLILFFESDFLNVKTISEWGAICYDNNHPGGVLLATQNTIWWYNEGKAEKIGQQRCTLHYRNIQWTSTVRNFRNNFTNSSKVHTCSGHQNLQHQG